MSKIRRGGLRPPQMLGNASNIAVALFFAAPACSRPVYTEDNREGRPAGSFDGAL
jgi:hypothetical protein